MTPTWQASQMFGVFCDRNVVYIWLDGAFEPSASGRRPRDDPR